jgi:hypothetical protein
MANHAVTLLIQAKNAAAGVINKVKAQVADLRASAAKLDGPLKMIGGLLGGLSVAGTVKFLVDVNREFGRMMAQLRTISGSDAGAQAIFRQLQDYAQKTPFQLNEVTQAYITLRSSGIQPTEEMMTSFGDIAAGRGKNITDFTAAVQDAVTGEMERLKEFGITYQQQGDKVKFTFNGVTTTVARNSRAVVGYLQTIGENPLFKGGMARQMNTLDGAISNFMDAMEAAARTVGEGGFTGALIEAIKEVQNFVTELTTSGTDANDVAMQWVDAFRPVVQAIGWVVSKAIEGWGNIFSWSGPFISGIKMLGADLYGVFAKIPLAISDLWQGIIGKTALQTANFIRSILNAVEPLAGVFKALGINVGKEQGERAIAALTARAEEAMRVQATNERERQNINAAVQETQDEVYAQYHHEADPNAGTKSWGDGTTTNSNFGGGAGGRHGGKDAQEREIQALQRLQRLGLLRAQDMARLVQLQRELSEGVSHEQNIDKRGELADRLRNVNEIINAQRKDELSGLEDLNDAGRLTEDQQTRLVELHQAITQEMERESNVARRGELADQLQKIQAILQDPNHVREKVQALRQAAQQAVQEFESYVGQLADAASRGMSTQGEIQQLRELEATFTREMEAGNVPLERRLWLAGQLSVMRRALYDNSGLTSAVRAEKATGVDVVDNAQAIQDLTRWQARYREELARGNLTYEDRAEIAQRLRDTEVALRDLGGGAFSERFGTSIREAVGEVQTLDQVVANLTVNTFQAFGQAVMDAFQAVVEGSKSAGAAFAAAMLQALAAVAKGMGDFYITKAVAALGEGLLGDPRGFAAAGKFTLAAAGFYALAGAVSGFANKAGGSGGGGSSASKDAYSRTNQVADKRGSAYLVVQGGLLDMSDPRQAEALAGAIENLTDRRIILSTGTDG